MGGLSIGCAKLIPDGFNDREILETFIWGGGGRGEGGG